MGDCPESAARTISPMLDDIERSERVRIIWAGEVGSRARGTESPDSDFDVRFVYVRELASYLSLRPGRKDTLERTQNEPLDVVGWDLRKYLQLAHKGNISVFEWGSSPEVYRSTPEWDEVWTAVQPYFSRKIGIHSYHGIAKSTFGSVLQSEHVTCKEYLRVLRSLLCCRYIEEHDSIPPTSFTELAEQTMPPELFPAIRSLFARKTRSSRGATCQHSPEIDAFISSALERYGELARTMPDDRRDAWEPLDAVFQKLVMRSGERETDRIARSL